VTGILSAFVLRWQSSRQPALNFTVMEYWLLSLLHAAARYSEWTGAYGDADVLAALAGPRVIVSSTVPLVGRYVSYSEARGRTNTAPVHATSTLGAVASNAAQLQACARRIASDLLADLGHVKPYCSSPTARSCRDGSTRRHARTSNYGCAMQVCPSMNKATASPAGLAGGNAAWADSRSSSHRGRSTVAEAGRPGGKGIPSRGSSIRGR
jgi:hypothetical protein